MMSRVDVDRVSKRYGQVIALDQITITFADGEFFGLLGPSGSGKTTLLRTIAGFVIPDQGTIAFDGEQVESVPVHRRDIGMVFQNYALFPHLTVADNIGFGLDVRQIARGDRDRRLADLLALVRLSGFGTRKPRELSGGQQQRVALARALATRPRVLLLDEPLGALDRRLRQEMQVELREIQRETGVTTIFVTHDQEEALTLSDRIAIINEGRLVQIGAPVEIYERPLSLFAAQFLGDANVLRGTVIDRSTLRLADGTLIISAQPAAPIAIVRPEKISVLPAGTPADGNVLAGEILQAVYSGASITYRIRVAALGDEPLLAFVQAASGDVLKPGAPVLARWSPEQMVPLEGASA
jgi:spermidine/putrescine transport system ATP-binding protein